MLFLYYCVGCFFVEIHRAVLFSPSLLFSRLSAVSNHLVRKPDWFQRPSLFRDQASPPSLFRRPPSKTAWLCTTSSSLFRGQASGSCWRSRCSTLMEVTSQHIRLIILLCGDLSILHHLLLVVRARQFAVGKAEHSLSQTESWHGPSLQRTSGRMVATLARSAARRSLRFGRTLRLATNVSMRSPME